jgi:hypothetical protein
VVDDGTMDYPSTQAMNQMTVINKGDLTSGCGNKEGR